MIAERLQRVVKLAIAMVSNSSPKTIAPTRMNMLATVLHLSILKKEAYMSNAIYLVLVFATCLVLAVAIAYDKTKTINSALQEQADKLQRELQQ